MDENLNFLLMTDQSTSPVDNVEIEPVLAKSSHQPQGIDGGRR